MEVIWKMPAPPDAVNVVDVSTATKKVVVGDYNKVATDLGISVIELQNELCPTPGAKCSAREKVFEWLQSENAGGVTHCDGLGDFTYTLNSKAIRLLAEDYAPFGSTLAEINLFVDHLTDCMKEHEADHVDWFKDPSNHSEDLCKGCCCMMVPEYLSDADCERSQQRAILEELVCLRNKWSAAAPGSHEELFLSDYRHDLRELFNSGDIC